MIDKYDLWIKNAFSATVRTEAEGFICVVITLILFGFRSELRSELHVWLGCPSSCGCRCIMTLVMSKIIQLRTALQNASVHAKHCLLKSRPEVSFISLFVLIYTFYFSFFITYNSSHSIDKRLKWDLILVLE